MTVGRRINATKTAFEIVHAINRMNGAGVSELANELNMPSSTVYDHLATLEEVNAVIKSGGKYRLSTLFLSIGAQDRMQRPVYREARSSVMELVNQTGEHAHLGVKEGGYLVLLDIVAGKSELKISDAYDGRRIHLHSSAAGKAILANLPRETVLEIRDEVGFPPLTENTITSLDRLEDELAKVRETGYALDDEEHRLGLRGVAAPIVTSDDEVQGALAVYGPARRMDRRRLKDEIVEAILSKTNLIQVNFDYS